MKSKTVLVILLLITITQISVVKAQSTQMMMDKPEAGEKHEFPLPNGANSISVYKIFESQGVPYLYMTYYPLNKIFVYNLDTDSLEWTIPFKKMSLNNFIVNNINDIVIFGNPYNGKNDSNIRRVNTKGEIQQVYSLIYPNIISSKYPPEILRPKFEEMYPYTVDRVDDKIFISFRYSYYGFKGYKKKYPIIGYCDLKTGKLTMNKDIWYPELKDGVYHKWFMHETYLSVNHKGNIVISFPYTPTFYEWNLNTNKLDTHVVNSQFMKPIPYSSKIYKNGEDSIYNDCNYYDGAYLQVRSIPISVNPLVFYRDILLPNAVYPSFRYLRVFYDENYQYLGENLISKDELFAQNYHNKRVIASIVKGNIVVNFQKIPFKHFDKEEIQNKLSMLAHAKIEKKTADKKTLCSIVGNNKMSFNYQPNDIIKYLDKTQDLKDTSYSVIVIHKNGCGSCNEYLLSFVKRNQEVLFNLKNRPFYLMYVDENLDYEGSLEYLSLYEITDKMHIKIDNSSIYLKFHPFLMINPRLLLVSQNKVICDEAFMPDELVSMIDKLLDYYHLKKE